MSTVRALLIGLGLAAVFAVPAAAAPTWLPPVNLSSPPTAGTPSDPTVGSDAAGESFASWLRSDGTHVRVQVASHGPGLAWGDASDLSPAGQDAGPPRLAVSASGFGAIAWTESNGTNVVVMVSRRAPGGAFGSPTAISSGANADSPPSVAIDAAGDIVVVWTDTAATALHARRFTAATNSWGSTANLASAGAGETITGLDTVMSAAGVATAAWLIDTNASLTLTAFQLQTSTQAANGTWPAATTLTPGITSPDEAGAADLAIDAAGNVTAAWFQYRLATATSYVNSTVFESTRLATSGVWQSPLVLSDPSLISIVPQVADTPAGETTVAWTEPGSFSVKVLTRPVGGAFPSADAATIIDPNDKPLNSGFDPSGVPYSSVRLAAGASGTIAVFGQGDGVHIRADAVFRPAGGPWPNPANTAPTMLSAPGIDIGTFDSPRVAMDGAGNAVAIWTRDNVIQAAAFDASPPSFTAANVPATGTTGQPIAMSASTVDTWSALANEQPTWSFGDTNLGVGGSVSHVYAAPGTYTVTVTATDAVGNASGPVTRQIVVTNPPIAPLPAATLAKPKLKAVWKSNKLVGSVTISGTVPLSTVLTATVKLRNGTKTSLSLRFGTPAGAFTRTLKLPSGLAPGVYVVTVSGNGVQTVTTSFTLPAPASGIVKRSYATRAHIGPASTKLRKTSQLWAHFVFGTLPKKGQKITTQWILPGGRKLSANARPRIALVEAQVKDLSGKNLPTGRWRCVIRVGGKVLVTLNVRLT
jgi:hypothetical protein